MLEKHFMGVRIRRLRAISCMLILFLFAAHLSIAQDVFPGKTWEKIKNPEKFGYSLEKLEEARKFAEKGKTAAVVIIVGGKILYEWGEVERDFITHSARESDVQATVRDLRELDVVRNVGGLLRVIGD